MTHCPFRTDPAIFKSKTRIRKLSSETGAMSGFQLAPHPQAALGDSVAGRGIQEQRVTVSRIGREAEAPALA